jgi:hypothetical protein
MSSTRSSFASRTTTNCTARNNLADAPIYLRDSATATLLSHLVNAVPGMFVNAAAADLHLLASATNAIDKGFTLSTVTNDFDGDRRPRGASSDIGADEFTTNAPPRIRVVRGLSADRERLAPDHGAGFATSRLWKKDDALLESGLLGPVRVVVAQQLALKRSD